MRPFPVLASFVLLSACGKVTSVNDAGDDIDADVIDGGATVYDAPVDANLRGSARVTVASYDGLRLPVPGATVLFVDPDGTPTRTTTDALGQASADVLPGASVTVVLIRADGADLRTVVGIQPGDDIALGGPRSLGNPSGTMTATFTSYGGATYYYVYNSCFGHYTSTTSVTTSFYDQCRPASVDFLVVAYNSTGPVAYRSVIGVPFSDGGTVNVSGAWTSMGSGAVGFTGIPAMLSGIDLRWRNRSATTTWQHGGYLSENGSPTGSIAVANVPGFGQSSDATLFLVNDDFNQRHQLQVRRYAGTPGTVNVDIGGSLLPWVNATSVDPGARTVQAVVTGGEWDLTRFWINYDRQNGPAWEYYSWVLFAPGGTTGLTLGDLPPDLDALEVQAGDNVYAETMLAEVDTLDGDQARQIPDDIFGDQWASQYDDRGWRYQQPPPMTLRISGMPWAD